MLILRQKSFQFCTPRLKTPQPALPQPQEKPVVNVLTVIFCHTRMGTKPFAHHVIILAPAIAQAKFYIPSTMKTQINLLFDFF